ncbi:MAG: 4-hydroxythreonine-4-phosphate dehydrogenase PdxA [Cyclobacteriaceae bacterium]|nr:4-hydroxythreonine-4-phosphate dehydrogenase PdxA [Cyclobacteriaceae bacterium SS2]
MVESSQKQNPVVIGISVGDYNGIGPEVIIKALEDNRVLKYITPVIYADNRIFSFYRKHFNKQHFNYHLTQHANKIHNRKINLVDLKHDPINVQPGKSTIESGQYAVKSLRKAVEDLKEGSIQGIVTCPISKETVQSDDFNFPGHTEYLTQESKANESLMLMVSDHLRVGVVTGHIALKDVSGALTKEKLTQKLQILLDTLKKDFGIKKPRVAVMGLNPHAGENGLLGNEEIETILPVIKSFKDSGHLVFGPFPADGFFGSGDIRKYDGILAMYHDQGLTPFKQFAFTEGVNYTAGLPIVRTSPDHGTAFSLAGKGVADETSLRNALFLAKDVIVRRME